MTQHEQTEAGEPAPPHTGNPVVDQALAEVSVLSEVPLAEHQDRLASVQDVLTGVLEDSRGAVQTPIPGVLRPGQAGGHRG